MLALQPDVANADDQIMPYIYLNNAMVLAKYFDKRENMKKQPGAYFHPGYPLIYFGYNLLEMAFPRFTGFYTVHGPSPLKKSPTVSSGKTKKSFCIVSVAILSVTKKISASMFCENIRS